MQNFCWKKNNLRYQWMNEVKCFDQYSNAKLFRIKCRVISIQLRKSWQNMCFILWSGFCWILSILYRDTNVLSVLYLGRGAVCNNKIICFRWFIIRALKNIVKGGLFGSENTGIFWIYKKRNYYSQYDESQELTFKGSVSNRIEISFKEGSQSQKFDGNNYYPFVDIDLYTKEKDLKEWNSTVPFFFCVSTSIHMSNFEKPVYEQDPVMSLRTPPVY